MDPTHTTRSSRPEAAATGPEDIQSPYNAVLLAELTQKLGSVEKAKEVYALFSASIQTSVTAAPPPTIPVDSTAQTAVSPDGRPQDSTGVPDSGFQQAETVTSTNPQETEEEEATGKLAADGKPEDGSEIVESERLESENPNSEGEEKGETPVLNEFAEGETLVETGDDTRTILGVPPLNQWTKGTLLKMLEYQSPSKKGYSSLWTW